MYPTTKTELRKIGCRIIDENFINCLGLKIEVVSMSRQNMRGAVVRSFYPIQTIEIAQGLEPRIEAQAMIHAVRSQYKEHGISLKDKSPIVQGVRDTLKGVDVDYSGPPISKQFLKVLPMLTGGMGGVEGLASSALMSRVGKPMGRGSTPSPPRDYSFTYQ